MITLVIASRDRAFQCGGLLQSINDHVSGCDRVVVIAKATSALHRRAYDALACEFPWCSFVFEDAERGFSMLLAEVIEGADHVCMCVDDQVFYRPADFKAAAMLLDASDGFVWSWRLGGERDGWTCSPRVADRDYGYVFHWDGALYNRRTFVVLLDYYALGWRRRSKIPNDLESAVMAARNLWIEHAGPHMGPVKQCCTTWQVNKEDSTRGYYGAPWSEVPATGLDALAEAFLAGFRFRNDMCYSRLKDFVGTHVPAVPEMATLYASMVQPSPMGAVALLRPEVIVEVGAADGFDTRRYARAFPQAKMLAFEPLVSSAEIVRRRVADLPNVSVHTCALGETCGTVDFWVSDGKPPGGEVEHWRYSSSLLPPHAHLEHHKWCTFAPETAAVRRLDSFGLDRVDFMHIDVQGAELAVLRGAGDLLRTTRAVWMEVSAVELYRGQPLRQEVEQFMHAAGFKLEIDAVGPVSGDQLWTRS